MVQVIVRTPLHATEDPERVQEAVQAFWPDMDCEVTADGVTGRASDLEAFRSRVWELQIIDTIRSSLLAGADGEVVRFRLSKQAALARRVSVPADRHALGDLDIKIQVEDGDPWEDAEALCWWLCPETKDGKIVGPTDAGATLSESDP